MGELKKVRSVELISVIIIVTLFTGWRIFIETMHYDSMLSIDQNARYESLASYNFWLNTIFPLVIRTILIVAAWYVFHYLVFPKIYSGEFRDKDIKYLGLAMVCTAMGIFLFYYFKIYISTLIHFNVITDLHAYSPYRKQTVVADITGMLIVFGTYEFLIHFYEYLYKSIAGEKEIILRLLGYFILAFIVAFLIIFAIVIPVSSPMWGGWTAKPLLICGVLMQVYLLQDYIYAQVIPSIQTKDFSRFTALLFAGILFLSANTFIIWICYSQFRWHFVEAVSVIVVFSLSASAIIAFTRHLVFKEKSNLQTQVSATSAELAGLRSQINPHFLFNALNSLYATALKEKSDITAEGIQKLGDMMRFMLEENNQERIPLDKEVEYLHNYIDIQRLRIDESQGVEIKVNLQQPDREIYIAPMMLNPFVENAFKHGVSLQHSSWIYITLTLDANRLYFKVHNSLHKKADDDPEESSSGVGLANVKKRLELLYPGRHTLDIQRSDKDFFVSLTLIYSANERQKQMQNTTTG